MSLDRTCGSRASARFWTDALISKFWDEDSWHVTETVKIDKITETIYNAVSPEATSYLYRNDDLTLVNGPP